MSIIHALPFSDYLSLDGTSASALKTFRRSPMAYKYQQAHPLQPTSAMELGTAAHMALLEPERFREVYTVYDGTRRGKGWEAFQEANEYRSILTAPEFADVCGMRDALMSLPAAARYLEHGKAEVTLQWVDPATGRTMKGRVDWVTNIDGQTVLVDLKTTKDSSQRRFTADAFKLGYHLQFALYTDGWYHLTRETPRFVVLAVESKGPYEPAVYDVGEDVLMYGHEEYMGLLSGLKDCEETNIWPPRSQEEMTLGLPGWATSDDEDLSDIGLDLSA